MVDGRNVFDQPINNMIKTNENIRKITQEKLVQEMTIQLVAC